MIALPPGMHLAPWYLIASTGRAEDLKTLEQSCDVILHKRIRQQAISLLRPALFPL